MLLVVGLGNPGAAYELTRHNIGFMLVDRLCDTFSIECGNESPLAMWGTGRISGEDVTVVKPLTFMNLSGRAVAVFSKGLSVPPQSIIVAYDDVDLPFGKIRIRKRGGSGGHNGLSSVIEHLGSTEFARIRLGIGRPETGDVSDHVLGPFTEDEFDTLDGVLLRAASSVETIIKEGVDFAMNRYNAGC